MKQNRGICCGAWSRSTSREETHRMMRNPNLIMTSLLAMVLGLAMTTSSLPAQEPEQWQARPFPTAEEVSRQWLPRHPRPRDEAEKQIIAVMDDMQDNQARGMGNVLHEDGRLMRMLAESLKAKHVVELGTANGYSALWFCLALRATEGKLTTHEIDPERIAMAKENFRRRSRATRDTCRRRCARDRPKSARPHRYRVAGCRKGRFL